MDAITYDRYGGPENLQLKQLTVPEPGPGQVLVRIRAASINPYDWHFLRGKPAFMRLFIGLRRPRKQRLGKDLAGVVEKLGPGVTRFTVGEEVFGISTTGTFGDYSITQTEMLARKPPTLSWPEAASLGMCGSTALQALDDAGFFKKIEANPALRVAINGGSGGIGHMLIQICKSHGAHVSATCKTSNLEWVRGLGADEAIDYTKHSLTDGKFDLIIDTVRTHPFKALRDCLTEKGTYICLGFREMGAVLGPLPAAFQLGLMRKHGRLMRTSDCKYSSARFDQLRQLADDGYLRPSIEQTFPLNQAAQAFAHIGAGHSRGKTVFEVGA